MTTSAPAVVPALEQAISQRIGSKRYQIWFENHSNFTWDGDRLVVGVPNLHFQEWLQRTFVSDVRAAAAEVFDRPMEVRFAIDPALFQSAREEQAKARASREVPHKDCASRDVSAQSRAGHDGLAERPALAATTPREASRARTRRWHRLSEFVVGPCNRVAHASAQSVIEAPGQGANPLVLHGPVGTGKTHLLEGIYAELRKSHPDWRICYVTAEDFTNRFVQAMRFGKLAAFRKYFRDCDALLVDDLHFLAKKRATQEEFQHTFDFLQRDGKQVVVTCDCHPRLADDFAPEMADRLLGGAIWGLAPPDSETRLDLLRAKSVRSGGFPLPEPVLRYVAERMRGNVRELEGALHSLRHYSQVSGRPVDLDMAREALADLLRHAVRVVQLADVETAICRVLKLEAGALQSKARTWAVSHPRMVAMYLARKHTAASYSEVGAYFGGRNHSTAVAAEKKVRQWFENDSELSLGERRLRVRAVIELIERELLR